MIVWLCGAVLGLSILLGGGTHAGFLGDTAVQILSVPLLAVSLWPALKPGQSSPGKAHLVLVSCCAVIFVLGVQLLPLPFDAWPGGASLVARTAELPLVFVDRTWPPLSLSPQATWAAAASFIVPAGIFLAGVQLNLQHRFALTWLLLTLGAVALLLGFLQVAQGPDSPLRFYTVTNPTEPVGFFANRNHFAAHLYVTLVLGAVWFANTSAQALEQGALTSRSTLWLTAAGVFLVSVAAGLAMARSRAGIVLAMAALIGIVAMLLRHRTSGVDSRRGGAFSRGRLSILTILLAALFAAQFGLGSILSRFESDPLDDLRFPLARTTFETAYKSLPFGTGLGTFAPVYGAVEKDKDVITGYANRAHNDLAEFVLETGIPGVFLLLAFFLWFSRRAYDVWFRPKSTENGQQVLLQRAATLIVALLLAHSLADYPLRTTALSAIFAFFCAALASEAPVSQSGPVQKRRSSRGVMSPKVGLPVERWGSGIRWPESWHK